MRPALRTLKSCCADTLERKFPLRGLWEDAESRPGEEEDPSGEIGAVWNESSLRREILTSRTPLYGYLLAASKVVGEILQFRKLVAFNVSKTTILEDLVHSLTCYAMNMLERAITRCVS